MRRRHVMIGGGVLIVAAAAVCGIGRSLHGPAVEPSPPAAPSTHVAAVALREGSLPRQLTLYGTVSPLSGATHTYALPFEAIIERLHVLAGQHVAANAPLFDSGRTPSSAINAQVATDLEQEATQRLEQVTTRQADGLATREEMIQAEGVLRRAQQQVATMRRAGQLTARRTMRAVRSGVVSRIFGQPGGLIPPGSPVLSITEDESIGIQLWAEPNAPRSISVNMPVTVEALGDRSAPESNGRVDRIDQQVDSTTRLVRISVVLDGASPLLLGQAVRARIAIDAPSGFIVPRASLVASDGDLRVFTVHDGRAHEHVVTMLVDAGDEVLIHGELDKDSPVITRGAYQVEDGMRVEIDP